jgi:hypothetical protein
LILVLQQLYQENDTMKVTNALIMAIIASSSCSSFFANAYIIQPPNNGRPTRTSTTTTSTVVVAKNSVAGTVMQMTAEESTPPPNSFREAEILGLRLMQEGKFEDALVGTCFVPTHPLGWFPVSHARVFDYVIVLFLVRPSGKIDAMF